MHLGHLALARQAQDDNRQTIVIVCGSIGDRGELIGLPLDVRYSHVQEVFESESDVQVERLDETGLAAYPDGWYDWITRFDDCLMRALGTDRLDQFEFVIYVGDQAYVDSLNIVRPQYQVVLVDRSEVPISATEIREHPLDHLDQITEPFRKHFEPKV